MTTQITLPIADKTIKNLKIGESVMINGTLVTARDAAHKWLFERFVTKEIKPSAEDLSIYRSLKPLLNKSIIYHCGPIVRGVITGKYQFISSGPTTSIREEHYEAEIIKHFDLKGIIGKGGMGNKTRMACKEAPAAYFHAIGGTGALIAQCIEKVVKVLKLDLGVPEAMWVIQVRNFPAVVTMDASGNSLHDRIQKSSKLIFDHLIN